MFEWWAVEQTRVSTSRQLSRSVCLFCYLKPYGGAEESHCFSHGPEGRGLVFLQESPRGGEDHAVRHGPGLIEESRGHRLSGPKHQVWAARSFRELLSWGLRLIPLCWFLIRVYNVQTGKLKKCLKGSSADEGALLKVTMVPSSYHILVLWYYASVTLCWEWFISLFNPLIAAVSPATLSLCRVLSPLLVS